jgi:hypothetical protein
MMEIRQLEKSVHDPKVTFQSIPQGGQFKTIADKSFVYMKIYQSNFNTSNTVSLENGDTYTLNPEALVYPIQGYYQITKEG